MKSLILNRYMETLSMMSISCLDRMSVVFGLKLDLFNYIMCNVRREEDIISWPKSKIEFPLASLQEKQYLHRVYYFMHQNCLLVGPMSMIVKNASETSHFKPHLAFLLEIYDLLFLPLCCMSIFDLRILITPLVSSNSSAYHSATK